MLSQESLYDSLALHLENYKKCYCHRGAVSFSGTCFELAVPVAHCVSVSKFLKSLSSKSQLPFHGGRTPSWLINKIKRKVALVCFGFFFTFGGGGEVCLLRFLVFFFVITLSAQLEYRMLLEHHLLLHPCSSSLVQKPEGGTLLQWCSDIPKLKEAQGTLRHLVMSGGIWGAQCSCQWGKGKKGKVWLGYSEQLSLKAGVWSVMKWLCCPYIAQILQPVLLHRFCMQVSVQSLVSPPFLNFCFFLSSCCTWTPIFLHICYLYFGIDLL